MRLFTAQPLCVIEQLQLDGFIYPRSIQEDINEYAEFKTAYAWLYQKMISMNKKIYINNGGMFWAHLNSEESQYYKGYLIELEKPLDEIIISDYMMWHSPLNNQPVVLNDSEDYMYDESKEGYLERKIKSWDRILDIKIEGNVVSPSENILTLQDEESETIYQACFTSIFIKDVVSITKINHIGE